MNEPSLISMIVSAGVSGFAALFMYLVRSYFKRIASIMRSLGGEIQKLEGKLEVLTAEVRQNTKETHGLGIELRGVWRFIDNANKRATDGGENVRDRN